MKKLKAMAQSARVFMAEVAAEMKKTSWPSRDELLSSTVLIIVSSLILSVVVGVSDKILSGILRLLLVRG
jgi:preprotein translocase subunit SecE